MRFVESSTASRVDGAAACLAARPALTADISAMRVLSGVGYGVLRPAIGDSTAIGGLMRRKLAPVLDPLVREIETLRGTSS
jgi:hypothetical protein